MLDTSLKTCQPPFSAEQSLVSDPEEQDSASPVQKTQNEPAQRNRDYYPRIKLAWPAFYAVSESPPCYLDPTIPSQIRDYIRQDVSLQRLDNIRSFLWFAGNVGGRASSLTECLEHNRAIKVTDRADMHVVTHFRWIYLKPLPDYLFSHKVWLKRICHDLKTYQDANTLMYSYTNILVLSKADLRIAHANGLINEDITWHQWTSMVRDLNGYQTRAVNIRWIYGELRLARLNYIFRFTRLKVYHQQDSRGWLIGTLVYITIVLTAMQVGLGTDKLRDSLSFQRASYGFTVFSIMAPVIILFSRWAVTIVLAIKRRIISKIAADRFVRKTKHQLTLPFP